MLRKEIMQQSVIYQEWRQEFLLEGWQEGLQQGRQQEALAILLCQLNRRFGSIAPEVESQVQALSLAQLEDLSEALLDFGNPSDLLKWLQMHS
jgi:predicted transposase YdaD